MNLALVGLALGAAWLFSRRKKPKKLSTPTMPEAEDGGLTPPPMYRDALAPGVYEIGVGEQVVMEFPNAAHDAVWEEDGRIAFELDHAGTLPARTWFLTADPAGTDVGSSVQVSFVDADGAPVAVYTLGVVG